MSFKGQGPSLGLQMQTVPRMFQQQHLTMTPKLEEHGQQSRRDILDKFARKPRAKRGRESEKLEQHVHSRPIPLTGIEARFPIA